MSAARSRCRRLARRRWLSDGPGHDPSLRRRAHRDVGAVRTRHRHRGQPHVPPPSFLATGQPWRRRRSRARRRPSRARPSQEILPRVIGWLMTPSCRSHSSRPRGGRVEVEVGPVPGGPASRRADPRRRRVGQQPGQHAAPPGLLRHDGRRCIVDQATTRRVQPAASEVTGSRSPDVAHDGRRCRRRARGAVDRRPLLGRPARRRRSASGRCGNGAAGPGDRSTRDDRSSCRRRSTRRPSTWATLAGTPARPAAGRPEPTVDLAGRRSRPTCAPATRGRRHASRRRRSASTSRRSRSGPTPGTGRLAARGSRSRSGEATSGTGVDINPLTLVDRLRAYLATSGRTPVDGRPVRERVRALPRGQPGRRHGPGRRCSRHAARSSGRRAAAGVHDRHPRHGCATLRPASLAVQAARRRDGRPAPRARRRALGRTRPHRGAAGGWRLSPG